MKHKIIGCICLFASSIAISFSIIHSCRRKVNSVNALAELVEYIMRNIDSFLTPLGGILSSYSSDLLEETGFADKMRKDGLYAAACGEYLQLPSDAEKLFISFAENIGRGYREDEINRCRYFSESLHLIADRESEQTEKNINMYRFIPSLGALSFIIAFM